MFCMPKFGSNLFSLFNVNLYVPMTSKSLLFPCEWKKHHKTCKKSSFLTSPNTLTPFLIFYNLSDIKRKIIYRKSKESIFFFFRFIIKCLKSTQRAFTFIVWGSEVMKCKNICNLFFFTKSRYLSKFFLWSWEY